MTMIKQSNKSLQEYYDTINQALNMVLTKITMSYKEKAEQNSLTIESQSKAIRTFITGLNSSLIRTTLYGNMPKTLSQAFAIAQTIQYDNQHLQLDHQFGLHQQKIMKKPTNDVKPGFNPNFRYQPQQSTQAPKQGTFIPHYKQQQKMTPMEVDSSGQNIQRKQFQPQRNDFQPMKREREPSFQHMNKHQRVNHVDAPDDIHSIYHHDSLENNCDDAEDVDCQSTVSGQELAPLTHIKRGNRDVMADSIERTISAHFGITHMLARVVRFSNVHVWFNHFTNFTEKKYLKIKIFVFT